MGRIGAGFCMLAALWLAACGPVSRGADRVTGLFGSDANATSGPLHEDGRPVVASQRAWSGTPDEVVGMSDADVRQIFGSPSYIRRESPAAVWQYRQGDCIVDMFLYTEELGDAYQVEHVELRPTQAGGALSFAERQRCLNNLARVG